MNPVSPASTLSHELGHFFGLLHSHTDSHTNTSAESPSFNCSSCEPPSIDTSDYWKDFCADTPVSPITRQLQGWDPRSCSEGPSPGSNCSSSYCADRIEYAVHCSGTTYPTPPPEETYLNLMSYSHCRYRFTPNQKGRMRCYIYNELATALFEEEQSCILSGQCSEDQSCISGICRPCKESIKMYHFYSIWQLQDTLEAAQLEDSPQDYGLYDCNEEFPLLHPGSAFGLMGSGGRWHFNFCHQSNEFAAPVSAGQTSV